MKFIKDILISVFLFLISGALIREIYTLLETIDKNLHRLRANAFEDIGANIISLGIILFLIRLCIIWQDRSSTEKKLLSFSAPKQLNQLLPIAAGLGIGIYTYYPWYISLYD